MQRLLAVLCLLAAFPLIGRAGSPQASTSAPSGGDQWLTRPVDDRTFATYLDFFAYDHKLPLETQTGKTEEVDGLRREHASFQSTAGMRVPAILFQTATAGKRPAIILLHGGSGPGKDGTGMMRLGDVLSRAGWLVLAIDFQYFGERGTSLMTTFSEPEKHDKLYNQSSVYLAWVTQSVKDVSRSIDFLVELHGADPAHIGIVGISRGAIVASIAAGVDKRLSPVLMLYGGHFDALETNHLAAACPANYIGRIAPRPLLMINGKQDSDMIKDRAVDPLFKLAKQPKEIIWTDGGHAFMGQDQTAAMIQWLRQHI
jgi:dienelactone hydrolase